MPYDPSEILIGLTEIAVALAGFTGVVVAFGSRRDGTWHPGDHARLSFLLEASLAAGGFSILALVLMHATHATLAWRISSFAWALYMPVSLYLASKRIRNPSETHGDVDSVSNVVVFMLFVAAIALQLWNAALGHDFAPLLIALCLNIAGSAMQFSRLIKSAFRQ